MEELDRTHYQPIEGVPVEIHVCSEDYFTYEALAAPFVTKVVSEKSHPHGCVS